MFNNTEEKSAILVIDPDPSLRTHLDVMFNGSPVASLSDNQENLTYLIHGCTQSETAKLKVKSRLANGAPYELLFIESRIENGSGLELISHLWQIDPDLHVVLCSADPDLNWQLIVNKLGESDQLLILQKPFSDLALRQTVHAMIRKWQLGKQSQNVMQFMEAQINQRTLEIQEANNNLLQSEKLAAVGQLAAGIAHEINTPAQYVGDNIKAIGDFFDSITRLLSLYRHLLSEQQQPELMEQVHELEEKEDLAYILEDMPLAIAQSLEGMSQIVRIVQAMKGFSHVGPSRIANINVNQALENTLVVSRSSYKYFADVVTKLGEIPLIECYPGELNQVFLNIIVNAAHAIEDGRKGRGTITVVTAPTEKGVEIRISDTGNGIPETIRSRVFDPFFTTKDVDRGSGQGLNIAYRIIHQQHRGTLTFTTETGVGTTFIINLHCFLPI
jgi:two-component system NtrC family sensor kinase